MKLADYLTLRGFARDALGDELAGPPDALRDIARSGELMVSGLSAAGTSAAGLLYYAAFLKYWTDSGGATPAEIVGLAEKVRRHAQALAAHLPERPALELVHAVGEALPQTPPSDRRDEPGKRWTPERVAELRAHKDARGTKAAAEHFGISTARVRELLPSDKPRPKPFAGLVPRTK